MSLDPSALVLLDTSVVVHLLRNKETGRRIDAEFGLTTRRERSLISTVTEGELFGLAKCWRWGEGKIERLHKQIAELVRVEAGFPEIVTAYAELYAEATFNGKPRGENDLWIGATAKVTGAVLLTCDKDFEWMGESHISCELVQ